MKIKSTVIVSLFAFIASVFAPASVMALDIPNFPACTSPAGTIKVSYSSGVHGIVGQSGEYIGSDIVYTVSDSQLTQCFCATSGSGIQTNWWKMGSLSQENVNFLRNLGWIFVADGSAWGLEQTAYMAQNTNYSCGGAQVTPTPAPGAPQPCNGCTGAPSAPVCTAAKPPAPSVVSVIRSGTTAQITWTAVSPATTYAIFYGTTPGNYTFGVPSTGNVTSFVIGSLKPGVKYYFKVKAVNDCMPSDDPATPQVLGASTQNGQVLGLAATGTNPALYLSLIAGSIFFILFIVTNQRSRKSA